MSAIQKMQLTLFSTSACHLCDEAEALLAAAAQSGYAIEWRRVDIANDDVLFERYGWLIPVLARDDGAELRWPFDASALHGFFHPG